MAEKQFDGRAAKRPSLKVSAPVELYNNMLRRLERQSSLPISCPEVTSTTGDYYGSHGTGWDQDFPNPISTFERKFYPTDLNYVEQKVIKNIDQKPPDDAGQFKIKEEVIE